jgi:hypothetical protein
MGVADITIDRQDMDPNPVPADGLTVDTYTGSGALPGTFVTIVNSGGVIQTADASPLYQGVQVLADMSGNFMFDLQRPASADDVSLSAVEVSGLARTFTPFVQEYTVVSVTARQFDFNGSSEITATGYIGVRGSELYTTAQGYGWMTAALDLDRGSASASPMELFRDAAWLSSGPDGARTFRVEVNSASTYTVVVHTGDTFAAREQLQVSIENGAFVMVSTPTAANMFTTVTLTGVSDQNVDGILDINFQALAPNTFWVVNGLEITEIAPVPMTSVASSFVPEPASQPIAEAQFAFDVETVEIVEVVETEPLRQLGEEPESLGSESDEEEPTVTFSEDESATGEDTEAVDNLFAELADGSLFDELEV